MYTLATDFSKDAGVLKICGGNYVWAIRGDELAEYGPGLISHAVQVCPNTTTWHYSVVVRHSYRFEDPIVRFIFVGVCLIVGSTIR